MAYSKTEIRNKALVKLGKLILGQTPQDKDKTDIEAAYDEVYEDLKSEGLTTWASTGSVPTELGDHVATMVAFRRAEDISQARYQRLVIGNANARREIRRLVAPEYVSASGPEDF